ncbi:hypothetical protein O181_023386 [Austropuccinia psidii MF-1]|uniref:Uncharacterized protein n=1 Tax=Austropuccinia psidii MF-1 TaxID=1389203 RepID=A0A9Q3GXL3_9BASI|nr:hypothetical protein [Austropuccinia psidii MF-1]
MWNPKVFTEMPGELKHAIKCICKQSCTPDDISNSLQDVRKRKNIGSNSLYRGNSSEEKKPSRFDNKDKPKEKISDLTKNKKICHIYGSTDHYSNKYPSAKKKIYATENVQEEGTQEQDSKSGSMGDAIRQFSDDDQDPI